MSKKTDVQRVKNVHGAGSRSIETRGRVVEDVERIAGVTQWMRMHAA